MDEWLVSLYWSLYRDELGALGQLGLNDSWSCARPLLVLDVDRPRARREHLARREQRVAERYIGVPYRWGGTSPAKVVRDLTEGRATAPRASIIPL